MLTYFPIKNSEIIKRCFASGVSNNMHKKYPQPEIGYYATLDERCQLGDDVYDITASIKQLPRNVVLLLTELFQKPNLILHLPIGNISKSSNLSSKKALFFPTYNPLVVYSHLDKTRHTVRGSINDNIIPKVIIDGDVAYIRDLPLFKKLLDILNNFDAKKLSKEFGKCIFCLSDHISDKQDKCTALEEKKKKSMRSSRKPFAQRRKSCEDSDGCSIDPIEQAEKILPFTNPHHTNIMNRIELEGLSEFNKKLSSLLAVGLIIKNGILTFPDIDDQDGSISPDEISQSFAPSSEDSESSINISDAIRMEYVEKDDNYIITHYPESKKNLIIKLGATQHGRKWIVPGSNEDKLQDLIDNLNKARKEYIKQSLLSRK